MRVRVLFRIITSLVLPLVTIVSLALAIMHWKRTAVATQSLSTQYIGSSPAYMPKLTETVQNANDTLLIASGLSGYGIYSDHDHYTEYLSAMQRKVGLREFKLIVLNEKGVADLLQAEFQGRNFAGDIDRSTEFRRFSEWSTYRNKPPTDKESFLRALSDTESLVLTNDFGGKGVTYLKTAGPMPIYVWIADNRMAVFSIPDLKTPNPEESAFLTYDSRLIAQLITIFRTYEDQAGQLRSRSRR